MSDLVNDLLHELIPKSLVANQQLRHERFILKLIWRPTSDGWLLLDVELTVPFTSATVSLPPVVVELWRRDDHLIYRGLVSGQAAADPEAGSRFGLTSIVFAETSDLEVRVTLAEPAETVIVAVPQLVIREAPGQAQEANDVG